jgi:hypothetical protein
MKTAALRRYRKRLDDARDEYFQDWPISARKQAACWRNLAATLDALIALGPRGSEDAARDLLRRCVQKFNRLDQRDQFICTIEREELCEMLYEIGDLCGLPADEEYVDEWRDW